MKDEKKPKVIEIINPNKPPVHVVCPFQGNVPIMVTGNNGQPDPQILPVKCRLEACVFYSVELEKCKIEIFIDKAIAG